MKSAPDFRSPLRKAEGLGSARSGTHHWLMQRATALALVPLALYIVIGFLDNAVAGGYSGAHYWLGSPLPAAFTIMFLLAGLYHGALGLQVVIEDYIHCNVTKPALVFATYFAAVAMAILGTLSVAKIFLGV